MGLGDYLFGDNSQRNDALDRNNFAMGSGGTMRDFARGQMNDAQGRGPAQMDPAQQAQIRARQMGLADQMARVADGSMAGAGELAANRQAQAGRASMFANNAMARGANAGIAARSAARGLGSLTVDASGQAQQAALGDQAAARGQLASLYDQTRGGDLSLANANLNANVNQRQMNDAYGNNMFRNFFDVNNAELQAREQRAQSANSQPIDRGAIGGLMSQAGQAASFLWPRQGQG